MTRPPPRPCNLPPGPCITPVAALARPGASHVDLPAHRRPARARRARFNGLIAARETAAWTVDRFGNYFHDVPHWHYAAFFNPVVLGDGLRLNLHFIDKRCDRRFCFAELHSAMLQALLQHCHDHFYDASVSREPDYGDEPFEG